MIKSMTGFAAGSGSDGPFGWSWELRSVNGRGLDQRIRVPDWIDGLETALRGKIGAVAARGNITCNLRIARGEGGGAMVVNAAQLDAVLEALHQIEARAMDAGVSLAPSKASDIVAMRGVLEQAGAEEDTAALTKVLLADFASVLADFDAMRQREGAALRDVLSRQLDEVARLTDEAAALVEARQAEMAEAMRRNLARVLEGAEAADPARVAQELALIAVKADITEEIDRLRTHVDAARELLAAGGPVGRKLDFLMQEFNRETNTLCSKAQHKALTATGLALKAVIEQMREQVQNVE